MGFKFASTKDYDFVPGALYLGADGYREIGLTTERHAVTIAGSRSGKGAGLIIPNLLRWPHNALVIDPKGENAELTWEAREGLGQAVHVIDPFHVASVPERLRSAFNPLQLVDVTSRTAREDIRVIADGLVMRHKAEDSMWTIEDGQTVVVHLVKFGAMEWWKTIIKGDPEVDLQKVVEPLRAGERLAVLLPDIEGVDSLEEQIEVVRTKAGVGGDQIVDLYRFEVQRYR